MEERGKKKRKQTPRLVDGVVCVAGGGIGGLGAALALQRRGVDVKVYERDASLLARPQGQVLCRSLADPAATDHVHIACALAGSRSTHACIWGGGRAVCNVRADGQMHAVRTNFIIPQRIITLCLGKCKGTA